MERSTQEKLRESDAEEQLDDLEELEEKLMEEAMHEEQLENKEDVN